MKIYIVVMVVKLRNWGNKIIKMILIVSNYDFKKNFKFFVCICKILFKILYIIKSIVI